MSSNFREVSCLRSRSALLFDMWREKEGLDSGDLEILTCSPTQCSGAEHFGSLLGPSAMYVFR